MVNGDLAAKNSRAKRMAMKAPGRGTPDRIDRAARMRADRKMFVELGMTNRTTTDQWGQNRSRYAAMSPKDLRSEASFLADKIPLARGGTRAKFKRGLAQARSVMAERRIR